MKQPPVFPFSSGTVELLALADEYEAGVNKMRASGYEEYGPSVLRKHQLTIDALRFQARNGSGPVAWMSEYDGNTDATTRKSRVDDWERLGRKVTPLYLGAAQAAPGCGTAEPVRQDAPNAELVEILAEMGRDGDGACEVAAKIIAAQDARIEYLEATEANEILRCKHRIEELKAALRMALPHLDNSDSPGGCNGRHKNCGHCAAIAKTRAALRESAA